MNNLPELLPTPARHNAGGGIFACTSCRATIAGAAPIALSHAAWRPYPCIANPRRAASLGLLLWTLLMGGAVYGAERRIEFENGDVYQGEMADGERNGRGIYTWASGNRYEGEFLGQQAPWVGGFHLDGRQALRRPIRRWLRHGEGTLTWRTGVATRAGSPMQAIRQGYDYVARRQPLRR